MTQVTESLGKKANPSVIKSPMRNLSILFSAASLAIQMTLARAESSPNSNDDQMRALKQSVDDASAAYQASTNDVGGKLWRAYKQIVATNLPQVLDLAQKILLPRQRLRCSRGS